jgi:hypothetical protein
MELFSLKREHIRVTATEHVPLSGQAIMYVGLKLHLFADFIKLDLPLPRPAESILCDCD